MIQIELEKVKEIKMNIGLDNLIIPKKYIKRFKYSFDMKWEENLKNPQDLECYYAFLDLDVDYLEIYDLSKNICTNTKITIEIIYYNEETLNIKLPRKYEIIINNKKSKINEASNLSLYWGAILNAKGEDIKMQKLDLEKTKEVRLCWDWEVAIIPPEYIKKIKYEGIMTSNDNTSKYISYECDYVYIELEKKYLEEHHYYEGNNLTYYKENNITSDSKYTIYEALNNYNLWDIEIVYKDDTYLNLSLPSKPISDVWSRNTLEEHKEKDDILKIRWATPGALQDIRNRKNKRKERTNNENKNSKRN